MPLTPGGACGGLREHHVHDVGRQLVIAPGNENLATEEPETIAMRFCTRLDDSEIRTGLGFRETHRHGPLAAQHARHVEVSQLRRRVRLERLDRAG